MKILHYINLIVSVSCVRVLFVKLYPERSNEVRSPRIYERKSNFCCNQGGLWVNER